MSSVEEDYYAGAVGFDPIQQLPSSYPKEGRCIICGKVETVYKPGFRDPECGSCFMISCSKQFRFAVGTSKSIPRCSKIMLVFDGTAESIALLDLLHQAVTGNTFKRVHFVVHILHLDDYVDVEPYATKEHYHEHLNGIHNLLKKYTVFKSFIVSHRCQVESMLDIGDIEKYKKREKDPEIDFKDCVSPQEYLKVKQDYIKYQRTRLICGIAHKLHCKYIFLPDIITSLAAQMLNEFSLGSGGNVALELGLLDDRIDSSITIVRPLKDFNILEVLLYLKFRNLIALRTQRYGERKSASGSIRNLTKQFVDNVQQNNSLREAIFGTEHKMAKHKNSSDSCSFCNTSINYIYSETVLALEFSRMIAKETERLCHSGIHVIDEDGFIRELSEFTITSRDDEDEYEEEEEDVEDYHDIARNVEEFSFNLNESK